jgi:hypothetical protein
MEHTPIKIQHGYLSAVTPPILIVGVRAIAGALGLDHKTIRQCFLGREGFPARKKGQRWMVTRERLQMWADEYLDSDIDDPPVA